MLKEHYDENITPKEGGGATHFGSGFVTGDARMASLVVLANGKNSTEDFCNSIHIHTSINNLNSE